MPTSNDPRDPPNSQLPASRGTGDGVQKCPLYPWVSPARPAVDNLLMFDEKIRFMLPYYQSKYILIQSSILVLEQLLYPQHKHNVRCVSNRSLGPKVNMLIKHGLLEWVGSTKTVVPIMTMCIFPHDTQHAFTLIAEVRKSNFTILH